MTYIRHPEARPRPLEPGEPRRATATDLGFTRDRHIDVPKSAIADLGAIILRGPRMRRKSRGESYDARAPQDDGDRLDADTRRGCGLARWRPPAHAPCTLPAGIRVHHRPALDRPCAGASGLLPRQNRRDDD